MVRKLSDESQELTRVAMTELNLSARAYDRILKVSRTVADLQSSDEITGEHVSEANSIPDGSIALFGCERQKIDIERRLVRGSRRGDS